MKRAVAEADHAIKLKEVQMDKERKDSAEQLDVVLPEFMANAEKIINAFAGVIDNHNQMNMKIVSELSKPKQITLGNVSRNADGGISGATAKVH